MYQFQFAPVPRLPSFKTMVVLFPEHTVVAPENEVGTTDNVFTVTETLRQVVVLQIPSILTK